MLFQQKQATNKYNLAFDHFNWQHCTRLMKIPDKIRLAQKLDRYMPSSLSIRRELSLFSVTLTSSARVAVTDRKCPQVTDGTSPASLLTFNSILGLTDSSNIRDYPLKV